MALRRRREVVWTEAARDDIERLCAIVAMDDETMAVHIADRIERAAAELQRFPERGRIVPELAHVGVTRYRERIVAPWRLVYRAEDLRVLVLALIDGRRNVEDVLLERLLGPLR